MECVDKLIERFESETLLSYNNCEKLANLYIIRDHCKTKSETDTAHIETNKWKSFSDLDFFHLAEKLTKDELLQILDVHIQNIKVLAPREYEDLYNRMKEKVENKA